MPYAYTGKILWVNLDKHSWYEETIPDKIYTQFLSGSGLGAYILYKNMPAGIEPLAPKCILGFLSGLLTASGALFAGRWMVVGKSPLTGTWGESNCGGNLSPVIKRCGYDGVFFTGKSKYPVYFCINKGQIQILPAEDLWGKDTVATQIDLRERHGKNCAIACIGPAGERLSLVAGICNDGARIAARSGLGALMGSKNLKALVLAGKQKTPAHNPSRLKALNQSVNRWVQFQIPLPSASILKFAGTLMRWLPWQIALDGWFYKLLLRKWGTIGFNQIGLEIGDTPVRNWRSSYKDYPFRKSKAVNPDRIKQPQKRRYHCFACPLGCGGVLHGQDAVASEHKPEYETCMAFSSLLLNEDTQSIFTINDKLNRAGIDSISCGATIAFAFECYEHGLLTKQDCDGLELVWGNTSAILSLLDKIIMREGIGDLLADGSFIAAQRIGKKASSFAMQAAGQELAFHDTRYDPGLALHAVVEPSPGKHTKGAYMFYEMFRLWKVLPKLPRASRLYLKGKKYSDTQVHAQIAAACSNFSALMDGCGICLFGAFLGADRLKIFEMLNAACGWDFSPEEYMQIGQRIQTLKQLLNAREGIALRHAINPRLLGIPPLKTGASRGRTVNLDDLVRSYYQIMDWHSDSGMPTQDCIQNLGLNQVIGGQTDVTS